MSETPSEGRPKGGGKENVLTHKIGPVPTWAWIAVIAGGYLIWRWYQSRNAKTSQAQASTSTDTTAANQVPQFVGQTYITLGAPPAPDTPATPTSPGATPVPTNPSPVGSSPSSQPKPTTTLSGWSYPAPSGLQAYNTAATGTRLSWNAVTGPSGQHPNSYTVATYDSKGKQVDQFSTSAGNTNTAEYGKGGKGLPKGTYHSNVWANGGPVAPSHASVTYTLKG